MNPVLMSALLFVTFASFGYLIGRKMLLLAYLSGKEDRFGFLVQRVKALFGMGIAQEKLVRRKKERASGVMHAFIFWGFMVLSLRTITLVGEGFILGFHLPLLGPNSPLAYIYTLLKDVFEAIVLVMIFYAAYRRIVVKPKRLTLSGEGLFVLVCIGTLMLTDFLYDGAKFNLIRIHNYDIPYLQNSLYGNEFIFAPIASVFSAWLADGGETINLLYYNLSYWLHMITVFTFLCFLPEGKHFHVITALPNVFLKSIGYPHRKQKAIDLENEQAWEKEAIGVNHIHQLSWKEGLDLYTCTECGRCQEVCPTYVTNKPLDLKSFNDDLKHEMFREESNIVKIAKLQQKIDKSEDPKEKEKLQEELTKYYSSKSLVGDVISEDTLWACTSCRACEEVCPVAIEHVPRIIEMRRGQYLMQEQFPKEMNTAFKGLEKNYNPWGIGYDKRADWAKELNIKTMKEHPDAEYLFWVGCAGSFDDRAQKVAQATAKILQHANIDFAILASEEKCTGDFARRAGNEMAFQELARENVETMNNYGVKKIITTCPHCMNTIGNEYPELGGNYEVLHHTVFIKKLVKEQKLRLNPAAEGTLTYHDPCYLGRYNKVYEEPRETLKSLSKDEFKELERNSKESFCCGAGGARMWMEENIGKRINVERVDEIERSKASTVAVGCPFCMTMLTDGVNSTNRDSKIQVKDVAELVAESLK